MVTVRQLLAHQAGLFALDTPIDRSFLADPDRLAASIGAADTRVGASAR
jgi:hypothetical protein